MHYKVLRAIKYALHILPGSCLNYGRSQSQMVPSYLCRRGYRADIFFSEV